MLYHVHTNTCIAIFFHVSYNSWVSTHSINQNNYYNYVSPKSINCRNSMTDHVQKNFHTISDFKKCCCIVKISHVSSRPNWYWTHAVCNQSFFFPQKNCYYFSDLETQWPRKPELSWLVMLVVGLIDTELIQSVIKVVVFFSPKKLLLYFSDLIFSSPSLTSHLMMWMICWKTLS